jgi:crotonobetainyl-CoA:carnitine CoA-transferase CaiB-like acyl-CoA transferase
MGNRPYHGLQVLEVAAGIAGAYCGKLFADAGADVVMLEPPGGTPLRRWTLSGVPPAGPEPGALCQYLAAGKRSVLEGPAADGPDGSPHDADLVILDGSQGWDPARIRALAEARPHQVVVSLSPFGLAGPYTEGGIGANEFVLQVMCGSAASRGLPEGRPLQAGGRIGEWVTGLYGAVAGAAVLRRARRTGQGDLVDVSMYESMVATMGVLSAVSRSVLRDAAPVSGRSIELPSIVATADGLVGFCTITRQQFMDFLVMIGRSDLLDDAELATAAGRMRRRGEFEAMVSRWAAKQTTADIIELAASMRIPVAPIGTPETVALIDHFAERGVFVPAAGGAFRVPRPPYRSDALDMAPFGPVPSPGQHSGQVRWVDRVGAAGAGADGAAGRPGASGAPDSPGRPLDGVRVLDLTAFWAGPVCTQVLAALGADVIKVEGLRRPDGMRFSSGKSAADEQWWEWGPVFLACNANKRGITLELSHPAARDLALRLAGESDLLIDNFSPRVMANFGLGWDTMQAANPRLVMVQMPAFGLDGPWRDRVGFAQTMEQASGMAWMTGEADGPPLIPRGPCDPVSGLHAAFAAIAGLEVRDQTGTGLHIESTMVEAALNIAAEPVIELAAYGRLAHRDGNRGPGAAPQGVYQCAGEDSWVGLAITDDREWQALLAALGQPADLSVPAYASMAGRRQSADAIDAAIGEWTARRPAVSAEAELREHGVPASRVCGPDDLLADPHLADRGYWEPVTHPVVGAYRGPGLPFRLASSREPWIRTPPPTLGQHNRQVLTQVLGLREEELAELEQAAIIGVRPAGL